MVATDQPINEARGPIPQDDRVRDVSLPARLYGSKLTHRLLPAGLALELVARVGPAVRQRRNPQERHDAENFMRELLLHTPRAAEAAKLGDAWLMEKSRLRELFWRPWLLSGSKVFGQEHWQAARGASTGCVIVFGHLVATWAVPAVLGLRGFDHYIMVGPHYWEPMPPGYEGLALLHRRIEYGEKVLGNPRLISSTGRPERLPELLQAGEAIAIAFDAPGRSPTPFLGRTVGLGGGAAALAFNTQSTVLPVVPERDGTHLHMRFYPPLDPREYENARSLRTAIARTFEPIVVARPEGVELAWHPSPLVTEAPRRPSADQDLRASETSR